MNKNENACAQEQHQKWTAALRSEMGMPESGSAADAVRWFSIGVPDEAMGVRLSTAAVESRVDLVATVFRDAADVEPVGFAVCYRTRSGASFGGCLPVELYPGAPLALYAPAVDSFYQLDDSCALGRSTGGLVGKSLRSAHQRAIKRLRRTARSIKPKHSGLEWQDLSSATGISIPNGKVEKVTVIAA